MNTFTVILNNGKQLDNLTQNGTMFVSATEVTRDDFSAEALKAVTVIETDDTGATSTVEMKNAICDGVLHWPDGWLFNLREPSEMERSKAIIESLTNDLTNTQLALCDVYEMIGG